MTKREELALAIRRSLKVDLNTLQVVTGEDEAVDAVLAALREPSPEMIEAALFPQRGGNGIPGQLSSHPQLSPGAEFSARFAAAIDSILEEPKS